MKILEIKNIVKKYKSFTLDKVSFTLEKGRIMGFIGRNGAGKTTTIKGIMNIIALDEGEINIFGQNVKENADSVKERIAVAINGVDFFPEKKIKSIIDVTSKFYKKWDHVKCEQFLKYFKLDANKKIKELSQGMKIKFLLSLALSHSAELLILDEPTSGLDPVSRDEVLEIFLKLAKNHNCSILFSTHITSDLDKVADDITYIKNGQIILSDSKENIVKKYSKVRGENSDFEKADESKFISYKKYGDHFEGLIAKEDESLFESNFTVNNPTIEDVMIFLERGDEDEEFTL